MLIEYIYCRMSVGWTMGKVCKGVDMIQHVNTSKINFNFKDINLPRKIRQNQIFS